MPCADHRQASYQALQRPLRPLTLNENDLIVELVKKLLATEDPAEIQTISAELRAAIHDRIQHLRNIAGTLKPESKLKSDKRPRVPERRRRERS